ncbi:MAG: DciA family protein [Burkholderiales bacterium]
MPLRDIRNLLGASSELAALREKTQRLLALQRAYVDCTPVELADLIKASRVGYLKAGTLYLLADSATVAAKLRQLLPRLLPVFRKLEAEVTGIHVDVQPKSPANSPATSLKEDELPIDYIEQLDGIAKTISNPDLKLAVTNLMRNRVRKP